MPAVTFNRVTRTYGDITALEDVSFAVPAGSICGVVGTSGAGKSTLLRTVNGLEVPTGGSVTVLGQEPAQLKSGELRALRRDVSMIFQHYNLLGSKTVAENVAIPLRLAGVGKAEIAQRVADALDLVGLTDRAGHLPRQLSGGQRQRVGIARALVTNPKIVLCDEPTSALDPITTAQILDLLVKINNELGITILIITHQMDVIAKIADFVAVLENGRLVEKASVGEIFARPRAELTRRFVETVVPQRLPASLAQDAAKGALGTVVRVVHEGGAGRSLLNDLHKIFGVDASLLHAADAPLRHTTVGTMVLGLQGPDDRVGQALDWLAAHNGITEEVLS
ncbi:methionine ABC transporter ATP-binding protein [Corynebacterium sp.]|uniref:methionine ABC transporter ATP-binding protein n=1 Tax=Corynebacterium sp. TaxID=1720 RepID=UPI002A91AA4A|nr:ATP-binding cassette domain-containing protein [Corynebacterium sp.]MDY5785575.1 ATP-binding cassette domain-containing protein [Corynebacterium sp.]